MQNANEVCTREMLSAQNIQQKIQALEGRSHTSCLRKSNFLLTLNSCTQTLCSYTLVNRIPVAARGNPSNKSIKRRLQNARRINARQSFNRSMKNWRSSTRRDRQGASCTSASVSRATWFYTFSTSCIAGRSRHAYRKVVHHHRHHHHRQVCRSCYFAECLHRMKVVDVSSDGINIPDGQTWREADE